MRAKTTSCPMLCMIPPITEIPITLTRLGPRDLINSIIRKLKSVPARPYKKVEKVPLKKVDTSSRKATTFELSLIGRVKRERIVIRLPSPSLAPGAKEKGVGIKRSKKEITTAWATSMVININFRLECIIKLFYHKNYRKNCDFFFKLYCLILTSLI